MTTTAKQILYSPVDIDDANFTHYEPDLKMESENSEFEAFKSEMHEAAEYAKITVSRQPTDSGGRPIGKKLFECFECGVDDYTFSQLCARIRDDFGTGLYKIRGRDSKGKFKFEKSIGVQAPKKDDSENGALNVGSLIDKFSDAMERQQARSEAMFRDLSGPRNPTDVIDQISKLAIAIGPILAAMGIGKNNQPPPKTLVEQLTEFKMIKELFGGDDDSGMGSEANLYSLLGETVKAFGGPIAAAIAAGAQSGDLTPEGLATTGRIALPAPKTDEVVNAEKAKMEMRKNIHILIQNAKTGIPPASFALILVNNTPENKTDALWDFISSENCVDEIVKIEPAAEMYREWFNELRTEVINLMAEPEDSDLTSDESGEQTPPNQLVAGVESKDSTESDESDSDTPINP